MISDIYGARVTPTGQVLDPENLAIIRAPWWQTWPAVASLGDDFLVLWDDNGFIGGARVTMAGTISAPFQVSPGTRGGPMRPTLAANGANYFAAWDETFNIGNNIVYSWIFGARLNRAGESLDGRGIGLGTNAPAFNWLVRATAAGADYWAVWQDGSTGFTNNGVWGARVRSDGIVSPVIPISAGFQGEPDAGVRSLALQSDGKILVGGSFWEVNGLRRTQIARLNTDGSLDTRFDAGAVEGAEWFGVTAVALEPDGQILIAGEVDSVAGQPRRDLARLNPDGSLDARFDPDWRVPYFGVRTVRLQPDGKIVAAGYFHNDDSRYDREIIRLHPDGTRDNSFNQDTRLHGGAAVLELQPDGKLLVGGWFGQGAPTKKVARFLSNGRLDPAFLLDPDPEEAFIAVQAMALQPDGKILIGGVFEDVHGLRRIGLARLNNDLVGPAPFVTRQISGLRVLLVAAPPAGTSVYAAEDQPPAGWLVTNLSHGGVFDPRTGKVKFGPFYDAAPRTLSYTVVMPPCWPPCAGYFTGTGSADGANTPIVGDDRIVVPWPHPADRQPQEWSLAIGEVTAYGAAWRRGETWPVPPNPIPIDYVTRAAFLWRGGECYEVNPAISNAPLWWVNCQSRSGVSPDAESNEGQAQAGSLSYFEATRTLPAAFVPGEPLVVTVSVSPAEAWAYAVEEQFPAGWIVANISDNGELDAVNGKVKWGPFLDAAPRTFSFRVNSPSDAGGSVRFVGKVSLDGVSLPILGASQSWASSRLGIAYERRSGRFTLNLGGQAGRRYLIEASTDLETWAPVVIVTNSQGRVEFVDPERLRFNQRFYRAQALAP
jgi:uncharacterized delta-60 repeat protein